MATKKKTVKKKPGLTAGDVFGRMLERATFFDYKVEYPGCEEVALCEFWTSVRDFICVRGGEVCVWDVVTMDENSPVVVKGDTVEVRDRLSGNRILFRFYGAPRRIGNLKEMVKSTVS